MRNLMLAAFLAAFFVPAFQSFSAVADVAKPEPVCRPAAHFAANLHPGERVVAHLEGEAATRFMKIYNAVPPETRLHADEILVLTKDGLPNVAVLRFVDGCFRDYGIHPVRFAEWLLRKAAGQAL